MHPSIMKTYCILVILHSNMKLHHRFMIQCLLNTKIHRMFIIQKYSSNSYCTIPPWIHTFSLAQHYHTSHSYFIVLGFIVFPAFLDSAESKQQNSNDQNHDPESNCHNRYNANCNTKNTIITTDMVSTVTHTHTHTHTHTQRKTIITRHLTKESEKSVYQSIVIFIMPILDTG